MHTGARFIIMSSPRVVRARASGKLKLGQTGILASAYVLFPLMDLFYIYRGLRH